MKKNFLKYLALGFPIGIAIGHLINIIISLIWGGGHFSPVIPTLEAQVGSEIGVVLLQTLLCGLLGSVFSGASIIWEIENWSIAKQTALYFVITALTMMPMAYFLHWMPHSLKGFLSYFATFVVIFIIVWIIQYLAWKNKIMKLNQGLK